MKQRKTILVIGLGAFGSTLVQALWNSREVEVIAVDEREEAVDAIKDRAAFAYVGDGSSARVLEDVGAKDVDSAVISFAEDFEASVMCVATLKRLGVPHILARAANDRQAEILRAVGATRVLELECDMGRAVAVELTSVASSELLDFAHGYRVMPWVASGPLVGQSLGQAALRQRYEVTVLGYARGKASAGEPRKLLPATPDYVVAEGDVLMLVGAEKAVNHFLAER